MQQEFEGDSQGKVCRWKRNQVFLYLVTVRNPCHCGLQKSKEMNSCKRTRSSSIGEISLSCSLLNPKPVHWNYFWCTLRSESGTFWRKYRVNKYRNGLLYYSDKVFLCATSCAGVLAPNSCLCSLSKSRSPDTQTCPDHFGGQRWLDLFPGWVVGVLLRCAL